MRAIVAIGLMLAGAGAGAGVAQAADYVFVRRTVEVKASPDAAWAKVGDFCGISKLLDVACTFVAGDGDVATVRSLANGATIEPMIARTAHSYTYGQTVGGNKDLDYHGTFAVEPAGRGRSMLIYTLVYDQARLPDDAARAAARQRMETRFQGAIDKAKAIVEAK